MKQGSFRIDHPLFENIIFSDEEDVKNAAERLCLFLIKNTDRLESSVGILRYATEEDDAGDTQTIWWWHEAVNARLTIGESE
jgi:hypothetical protein